MEKYFTVTVLGKPVTVPASICSIGISEGKVHIDVYFAPGRFNAVQDRIYPDQTHEEVTQLYKAAK